MLVGGVVGLGGACVAVFVGEIEVEVGVLTGIEVGVALGVFVLVGVNDGILVAVTVPSGVGEAFSGGIVGEASGALSVGVAEGVCAVVGIAEILGIGV